MTVTIPTLQTERLTLRAPQMDDFALYRDFYADADGSGNYGGPLRADQAFHKLAADLGHWQLRGFGMWIVTTTADNQAIGGCGIFHPVGWPNHELTWWLNVDARGNGYAAEASRAVIRHACAELRWTSVLTHMRDDNTAARNLATRLGGKVVRRETFPDGVTRDVFAFDGTAT